MKRALEEMSNVERRKRKRINFKDKSTCILDSEGENPLVYVVIENEDQKLTYSIHEKISGLLKTTDVENHFSQNHITLSFRDSSRTSATDLKELVNTHLGNLQWSDDPTLIEKEREKRKKVDRWRHTSINWTEKVSYTLDNIDIKQPKIYVNTKNCSVEEIEYLYLSLNKHQLLETPFRCLKKSNLLTIYLKENGIVPVDESVDSFIKKYLKGDCWNNNEDVIQEERQKREVAWKDNQQTWNKKVEYIFDQENNVVYVKIVDENKDEHVYVSRMLHTDFEKTAIQYKKIINEEGKAKLNIVKRANSELPENKTLIDLVEEFARGGKIVRQASQEILLHERNSRKLKEKTKIRDKAWYDKNVVYVLDESNKKVYVKVNTVSADTDSNSIHSSFKGIVVETPIKIEIKRTSSENLLTFSVRDEKTHPLTSTEIQDWVKKLVVGGQWITSEDQLKQAVEEERLKRRQAGIGVNYWRQGDKTWEEMVTYTLDEMSEKGPIVYVNVKGDKDDVNYAYTTYVRPQVNRKTSSGCLYNTPLVCVKINTHLTIQRRENSDSSDTIVNLVNRYTRGGSWDNSPEALERERLKRQPRKSTRWRNTEMEWRDKVIYIPDYFDPDNPVVYVSIKEGDYNDARYVMQALSSDLKAQGVEVEMDDDQISIWRKKGSLFSQEKSLLSIIQNHSRGGIVDDNPEMLQTILRAREKVTRPHRSKRWLDPSQSWDNKVIFTADSNSKFSCVYVTINGNGRDFDYACQKLGEYFTNMPVVYVNVCGQILLKKRNKATLPEGKTVTDIVLNVMKIHGGVWDNNEDILADIKQLLKKRLRVQRNSRYPHSQQKNKLSIDWGDVVFKIDQTKSEKPLIYVDSTKMENEGRIFRALTYDLAESKLRMVKIGTLKKGDSGRMAIALRKSATLAEGETIESVAEEFIRGGFYDDKASILCVQNWRYIRYTLIDSSLEHPVVKVEQAIGGDKRLEQDMRRICAALNLDLQRTVLEAVFDENQQLIIRVKEQLIIPSTTHIKIIMTHHVRGGHWFINGQPIQVWNGPRTLYEVSDFEMSDVFENNIVPMDESDNEEERFEFQREEMEECLSSEDQSEHAMESALMQEDNDDSRVRFFKSRKYHSSTLRPVSVFSNLQNLGDDDREVVGILTNFSG